MKQLYLIVLLLLSIQCTAQNAKLTALAKNRRYTELKREIENGRYDNRTKEIYRSIVYNVFGKANESRVIIDRLLASQSSIDDSTKYMLLQAQHDNYAKLFMYEKALEIKQTLMREYADYLPKENIEDELQVLNIWKALKNTSAQEVIQNTDTTVLLFHRDFVGLQRIPVKKDDSVFSFIFDTGAGISTVTDSMAEVLHLKIIDHIPIMIKGGVTGIATRVKLGIADSIYLGDILVKNVVFLVFPDSAMTFRSEQLTFKIAAIIGFPVIKELGSITFYDEKVIIAKEDTHPEYQPNMAVDLLKPIIFLGYNGEDLPFTFDTGADESILSESFYDRYKKIVDKKGKKKERVYGSAGGTKKFTVMVLPSIKFTTMNDVVTIKNIPVSTTAIHASDKVYYGNLGQDLVKQYRSMTINFSQSWIRFNR